MLFKNFLDRSVPPNYFQTQVCCKVKKVENHWSRGSWRAQKLRIPALITSFVGFKLFILKGHQNSKVPKVKNCQELLL